MTDHNGNDSDYYMKEIEPKMKLYRSCMSPLPKDYIDYHSVKAIACLLKWEKRGVTVHSKKMVDAGWMDGMTQIQAVIELPSGRLIKVQWHDANSSGNFMEVLQSGGQCHFDLDKEIGKDYGVTLATRAVDNHGHSYPVIIKPGNDRKVIKFEGTPGPWFLDSVMSIPGNEIHVDFGAGWKVINLDEIKAEVRKLVSEGKI